MEGERDHPLARLLPEITYIYGTEANEHSCIVGKQSRYLRVCTLGSIYICDLEYIMNVNFIVF